MPTYLVNPTCFENRHRIIAGNRSQVEEMVKDAISEFKGLVMEATVYNSSQKA